jgi:hypothetical protein
MASSVDINANIDVTQKVITASYETVFTLDGIDKIVQTVKGVHGTDPLVGPEITRIAALSLKLVKQNNSCMGVIGLGLIGLLCTCGINCIIPCKCYGSYARFDVDCRGNCNYAPARAIAYLLGFGSGLAVLGGLLGHGGIWVQMRESVIGPFNFVISSKLGIPRIG